MLQRVFFWGLFFGIQYAGAALTWKTPTSGDDLKANTQDSVWLDWSSTYPAPILRMFCLNETDGNKPALISSFEVDTNGPFEYIMDSFLEPNKMKYPLICNAELAKDEEDNSGVVCPVGIVWSYDAKLPVKTVSQTQAAPSVTTSAASKPTTTTLDPIASKVTTGSPSQLTGSPSNTEQSTADSSSPSPSNPTSSTEQTSTPSTGVSASESGVTTDGVSSASSRPNNTGAIVGGVVGGIAVLSFIIFGLLFLRRQKRNSASSSPANSESLFANFSFFKKGDAGVDAAPVYEKEGSGMARELEANAGGKANLTAPVELPAGANH
ncbi:hypothetical protein V493_07192 [Pseudogymnoascus sp. VKM F-4281 (FW-2241)]|nr:hypothetical protein V493_07192 [Pseudogymnoascus sp. VKM F-4281 (FW-2241)]